MRSVLFLIVCTAAGCTLFGDRLCEPGRYLCPSADSLPPDDGGAHACALESPCALPAPVDRAAGAIAADVVAVSGRGELAFMAGGGSQGVLLSAGTVLPLQVVATLPTATPRALDVSDTGPLSVFIASQGSALYQFDPASGLLSTVPLDTGGCKGRINLAGAVNGVRALAADDLWLVGVPTSDAAAGLFRVRAGQCQVLPELASTGLSYNGVWGARLAASEPADRVVWTVGDSGAAVLWSVAGADGTTRAQRFALDSGDRLRAVASSVKCATDPSGELGGSCAFLLTDSALYRATQAGPQPVALPAVLRGVALSGLFFDGDSVWLVGSLGGRGVVARYQPQGAAWSYLGALPPASGALRGAWGPGDGSLWIVGDHGTVLYLPPA